VSIKLVRDAIRESPGFIRCSSDQWRPVRDEAEHAALLLKKIHEELGELLEAVASGDEAGIRLEGCDLLEVLTCFIHVRTGATPGQIARGIEKKQLERGGFYGGLVWDHP